MAKEVNFKSREKSLKRPIEQDSHHSENKKMKLPGGGVNRDRDELRLQRKALPIFSARKRLLCELNKADSAIVLGETGSGKTTQIPQYLIELGLNRKLCIACTQPRRVAAISIAQRVAQEKNTDLGGVVGYTVRFDDMTSTSTQLKYMTDGMLLREAILDPLLRKYSIIILDEAHERTIHTDVLFGVVKVAQRRRQGSNSRLKVIVMSATMDVDHFSQYFNKAPVLYLEGRQHPIQLLYAKESQSDYLFSALVSVFQIHQQTPAGQDILVFLTGQEEIESMTKSIKDIAKETPQGCPPMMVCPMYAALPPGQQLKIFQPTPKGARKVILATNIAETSVTIPGIKFVIDTGVVKAKSFNAKSGLDMLRIVKISKAQAWQRTGRAGRESPGTCYRLYTEKEFEALSHTTVPEIQRCNLSSVVLQLLALGIRDIMTFDFMDKPSSESLETALVQLELLGAIENTENPKVSLAQADIAASRKIKICVSLWRKPELTPVGRQMAAFPLDPRLSKALLAAKEHRCLEEMLTIVALLSVDSILHVPVAKREEACSAHRKFISSDGDHVTYLNIFRAYKGAKGNKQWCHENYVNGRNMATATEVRRQIKEICVKAEMECESCGRDLTSVRRCLAAGFFMNAAELQREGEYFTITNRKKVIIHPSSALFTFKPACVIYNELVQTSKCYMRDLCVIDPDWLIEIAPAFFKGKRLTSK